MKKLKATLTKTHAIYSQLVIRQNFAVEKSAVDYEKAIEDIRMKSYVMRRLSV